MSRLSENFWPGGSRRLMPGLTMALVLALLLCHGAFGSLHLVQGDAAPGTSSGASHGAMHTGHDDDPGQRGPAGISLHSGMSAEDYFAVPVAAALLGALAALALPVSRVLRATRVEPAIRRIAPAGRARPNLPRGPTLPALQVFRL
ncbi:Hypothetical Protein RradSPS_2598 [Rubrobacter radiotolerans]|uniref:Uncharacterized protein n=1 Tax=Rubrobacter radiotolerans TaxID=42256 RepID=A0A023X6N1_RUBRA|nr:hypothetical protein [Rubrobacter radiotolerans]AHY47881.1 Hypothetical Protein RradSPS_2598 [Rubrobacter radiotolerans]MDX5892519.1 hypothetical protein [Rubrobacter radiotolerans]SMC07810.1 hypothetical protein SAMN00767673_2670 [Rubrobacter radiotolerans DSM 5868]